MSSSTSNGQAASREFRVGMVGFSPVEKSLITGVFKLSQARLGGAAGTNNRFALIDLIAAQIADIYLIDAECPSPHQKQFLQQARSTGVPLIIVSKEAQETIQPHEYNLTHKQLIGLLLRKLDKIVDEHLKPQVNKAVNRPSRAKQCLVVDDSKLVRAQMELILNEYASSLDVEFAEDAETALQRVKEKRFDLIFLDVMLPEMDGYKACKLLKADPVSSTTPVVMLTSKKSPFNRMHGALVGCDKYLTKPIDAKKVNGTLERYNLIRVQTGGSGVQPVSA
jgi:twitching motility two-component system response regulator PilG